MKIAMICDVLGVPNNGTTVAAYNLINYLKKVGHEVHVVCPDQELRGQENYHVLKPRNLLFLNWYIRKNGVILAKADVDIIEPVVRDADLVYALLPFNVGKKAVRLALKYDKPICCACHCQAENFSSHFHMMNFPPFNSVVYRVHYNNTYKYADCVHYPSQFISDYLKKRGFQKNGKGKPFVITNGVNPGIFPIDCQKPAELDQKFVILFTGRLVKEKAQKVLLKAIKYSKYKEQIQIILAGSGPRERSLRKLGSKLPNEPIIKFFTREEINQVINYSDLYVHPSPIEIEAISCNEAVSCGLVPVISNSPRSAATQFALDQNNLFKQNSPRDLARRIDFWIEHPELREKYRQEYLKRRNPLSVDDAMHEMEKMLFHAVELKKAAQKDVKK